MYTWIFGFGIFAAFYNAWGGGANDVANSFSTAVGSNTLTLRQAVVIAAIFEFTGAVLMGSHVTDAVRKDIVDVETFTPGSLMLAMLCADLASAIWLTVATSLQWPVSTTHSIIGAIIGAGLAAGGSDTVNWEKVGWIGLSWIASPLIAGTISLSTFTLLKKVVFDHEKPYDRTRRVFGVLWFFVWFVCTFFIIYKGSPALDLDDLPVELAVGITFAIATGMALIAQFAVLPYLEKRANGGGANTELPRTASYTTAVDPDPASKSPTTAKEATELAAKLRAEEKERAIDTLHDKAFEVDAKSEKLCSWLQVTTSCFSSFAHGSNDVANAIAPLATIYSVWQTNQILEETPVPVWILALGGGGIVLGLATYGYKIIEVLGRRITKISASRGFLVELAAATTVVIGSRAEIPVSTTHCQVGSVVGIGLSGGRANVNFSLLKGIFLSWVITLPATGLLSAAMFSFAYYSPAEGFNATVV